MAKRVDRLDTLEPRTTITEPISLTALSLGIAPALVALGIPRGDGTVAVVPGAVPGQVGFGKNLARAPSRAPNGPDDVLPLTIVPKPVSPAGRTRFVL